MFSQNEFQGENLYGVCNLTYWLDNQFIRYPQPDNSLENCIVVCTDLCLLLLGQKNLFQKLAVCSFDC